MRKVLLFRIVLFLGLLLHFSHFAKFALVVRNVLDMDNNTIFYPLPFPNVWWGHWVRTGIEGG
jgi:hypothetical protein